MSSKEGNSKIHIVRVSGFHDGSLEFVLSNGNYFVVEAKYILAMPGFEMIGGSGYLFVPIVSENGDSIYWRDGPRQISIDELLSLIVKDDGEQNKTKIKG